MINLPLLESERLLLKFPELKEADLLSAYYQKNRDYLQPFEPRRLPAFYTSAHWKNQIELTQSDFLNQRKVSFLIFEKGKPDSVIGVINFNHWVQGAFQSCIVGFSLDEEAQGKGFMQEALTAAIDFVFAEYGFHRIEANYMPRNQRSEKLLLRLEFEKIGLAPNYLLINGYWEDHVLTQKLNLNWIEPQTPSKSYLP
jgi:[ribosomal protein S5]-alanine N-acetyltransferase